MVYKNNRLEGTKEEREEEISWLLQLLGEHMRRYPHRRLGQLLVNLLLDRDLFYVEDTDVIKGLLDWRD